MKLRTSFFNVRALGKDITRYSPAWALYSVVLALTFLIIRHDSPYYTARNLTDAYMALAWFNFIYAPICALLLFGDVLNSRMCNALHALPMRREGWFLTHITSAFLFALVPNGIFSLVCSLFVAPHGAVAGMFFAIAMLQFLFFFGAATLAIFCVGNRFAAAVVYAIINFLPMLIYVLLYNHYVPLLYGLTLDPESFLHLCPMYAFCDAEYASFSVSNQYSGNLSYIEYADWRYLAIAAGVGLVFLVIAMLLYRRRKLECAGDFVAFKPLGPVFLVLYTAAVGTFLYAFGNELLNEYEYLLLALGLIVGYFTGRMLLDRTVKVFHKKSLLGFVTITAVLALTMGITYLDPMGVVTKVPQLQDVQSVSITTSSMNYQYQHGSQIKFADEATIQKILNVHQYQAQTRNAGNKSINVEIRYTLTDGSTLLRMYPMDVTGEQSQSLKMLFSSWQYIFKTDDWKTFCNHHVDYINMDETGELGPDMKDQILDALYQDCMEGNLVQDWSYHSGGDGARYWIYIGTHINGYHDAMDLTIFESCHNTIAVLEAYFNETGSLK